MVEVCRWVVTTSGGETQRLHRMRIAIVGPQCGETVGESESQFAPDANRLNRTNVMNPSCEWSSRDPCGRLELKRQ
jgi:hypothetical protein